MKTGKGPKSLTGAKSILEAQRRAEILRLRLDGLSLQEVGDRLGIKPDTVHGIITRALASMCKEPAHELLGLELARLESLYAEAMDSVRSFTPVLHNGRIVQIPVIDRNGEVVTNPETEQPLTRIAEDRSPRLAGVAAALRVLERRAKLLGLDAPVRANVNVTNQQEPQDLSHLTVEELEAIKNKIYGGQRLLASTQKEGAEQ